MLKDDPILWDLYNKSQKSAAGENRFRDFGQLKVGVLRQRINPVDKAALAAVCFGVIV
jgi:hypothetical protein